ncbi:hypothetical protein CU098_003428, partial [Rhizopus stolonifer]
METPIEVLRVEQSGVSKELARFRACDMETRSLYCREWAQFIYKKHFVWNAKTQEEVPENQTAATSLSAGKYQINFLLENDASEEVVRKERAALMAKKFEQLQEQKQENDSLINQIIEACQAWMTLPSGYSGLPDLFEPVQFNPYPDNIPLVDDPKDPSHLLDPLIIERQALCLPSDCFHLLKNLTGDILLSHTTPTCNHTRPESKTPGDLEIDRTIFNEKADTAVKKALAELKLALERAWHPLNSFLEKLSEFEKRRTRLMGNECQATIDDYFTSQKFVSFVDSWPTEQAQFKNKKSTPEEIAKVDSIFENHLNHFKTLVLNFMNEFAPAHMKEIHTLTTDLWKLIVPTIYEMGERMASHEDHKGTKNPNAAKIGESLKALDVNSLKRMDSTKEVDIAQDRIVESLNVKVEELFKDIDSLLKAYKESLRSSLSGRIERLNNKDMKKKIKKVESGYYSIRQTFRYEVTENIFPESLFCKFSLVCLEPLMQEGEVMEAVTIEKEVKRFVESHKDLLRQRCSLLNDFEDGVQTGRRELAGVLGKLFLKEGMRIQGDNLALKRQNNLLKSMGVSTEETSTKKKKGKKKPSPSVSGASTPATVVEEPPASAKKVAAKEKVKEVSAPSPTKSTVAPKEKVPSPSISTAKKTSVANDKKAATPVVEKKIATPPAPEKKAAATAQERKVAPAVAEKKITASVAEIKPTPDTEKKKAASPNVTETKTKIEKNTVPFAEKKLQTSEEKPAPAVEKKAPSNLPPPRLEKKPTTITMKKKLSPSGLEKKPTAAVENKAPSSLPPPGLQKKPTASVVEQEPVDGVIDWETIQASVLAEVNAEQESKTNSEPVQDWNRIKTQSAEISSWSAVASEGKKWSEQSQVTKETTTEANTWSGAASKSNKWASVASGSPTEKPFVESNAWSTNATAPSGNDWTTKKASKAGNASTFDTTEDTNLGGWGAPATTIASKAAASDKWSASGWGASKETTDDWKSSSKSTTNDWKSSSETTSNNRATTDIVDGWGSEKNSGSNDSWNKTSDSWKTDNHRSDWDAEKKKNNDWGQSSNSWGNRKTNTWSNAKKQTPRKATNDTQEWSKPQQEPGWEGAKLPWNDEPVT